MGSIKNKIEALEECLSPKIDFAKDLVERLREARERALKEGLEERVRDLKEILKDRPDLSPEDTAEIAKIRGQLMREKLRKSRME